MMKTIFCLFNIRFGSCLLKFCLIGLCSALLSDGMASGAHFKKEAADQQPSSQNIPVQTKPAVDTRAKQSGSALQQNKDVWVLFYTRNFMRDVWYYDASWNSKKEVQQQLAYFNPNTSLNSAALVATFSEAQWNQQSERRKLLAKEQQRLLKWTRALRSWRASRVIYDGSNSRNVSTAVLEEIKLSERELRENDRQPYAAPVPDLE